VTNYYELLSVGPTAAPEEIKRKFREAISRYHPDKVQHLGKEFQEMAATRAAQLTEAYRILMNAELRAEYDRQLQATQGAPPREASPPREESPPPPAPPEAAAAVPPPPSGSPPPGHPSPFFEERSTRDVYVRQATLGRIRQAVVAELPAATELLVRGFDLAYTDGKKGLFGKGRSTPAFLVRLVRDVNRAAIRETWAMAAKAVGPGTRGACVLVLGAVTAVRDARDEVAALRRQPGKVTETLCLVPVDIRDWAAHAPRDTPQVWRSILDRVRQAGR